MAFNKDNKGSREDKNDFPRRRPMHRRKKVCALNAELLEVEPEIIPYMLTNEIDEINTWLAANGNKPLVSQKASVKGANLTQDPEKDFEQIQEEANAENSSQ